MIHGKEDEIVPVREAQKARDLLRVLGAKIEYHELTMAHEISPEAINLLRDFIIARCQTVSRYN